MKLHEKMKTIPLKRKIMALLLVFAILFSAWYFLLKEENGDVRLTGLVEATLYSHVAEVAGKVIEAPIQPGQEVREGDLLFVIDDTGQSYMLDQLELSYVQKEMALAALEKGVDQAQLKQAQNNVAAAKASYEKISSDYKNSLLLYSEGAISKTALDGISLQRDLAATQLDTARQQVVILDSGTYETTVAAAEASLAQVASQIDQMKETLEKFKIHALSKGTVVSKNFEIGDMVSPGNDLLDLASSDEVFVVAYLPLDLVPLLNYGQEIPVWRGEDSFFGAVSYIDVVPQYTPKDMQTAANKNRDTVKIRLKLSKDAPLKPGEIVELRIPSGK